MLNHNMTSPIIKSVLFALLFLVSCSCISSEESKPKYIKALLGCDSSDAYNDLLYSLEGIKKLTENNDIKINTENNDKRCGYLLIWKSEKYIEGVLTDYDLMLEAKSFFKLP